MVCDTCSFLLQSRWVPADMDRGPTSLASFKN